MADILRIQDFSVEELNNRRDEILKYYKLDEESIREFRKDIKKDDYRANKLAKEMFIAKYVGYRVSDDYLQKIKDGANINYGTGDYDKGISLILKSVSTSFYDPINIDIFLNLIRAGAKIDTHESGITLFQYLISKVRFYEFKRKYVYFVFKLLKLTYLIGADVSDVEVDLVTAVRCPELEKFVKDAQEYEKQHPDNYQNRQLKYPQSFEDLVKEIDEKVKVIMKK